MGQMFGLLGTLMVLGAGLHRTMLAALLRTFATAPVGTVTLDPRAGLALLPMAGGIFAAALQLSAPVLAATLLAELAVALAGKMSPHAAGDGADRAGEDAAGVRGADRSRWRCGRTGSKDASTALLDEAGRMLAGAAGTA